MIKIKVGVFFGGESVEHEVSIISAIQAIHSFDLEKYDIIPIYIAKTGIMYIGENIANIERYIDIPKLLEESQRITLIDIDGRISIIKFPFKKIGSSVYDYIDIAFPIIHGTNVEDGTLQGYFKTIGIPYVGCDVVSSAVGMDKYISKAILKDNGLPVLDCYCANVKEYNVNSTKVFDEIAEKIGFPVIVKPINLGSSVGIKKAANPDILYDAVEYAFEFSSKILVERAVEDLKEINCSVLGDYENAIASECEEPINSDEILSYQDKYLGGSKSSEEPSGGTKGISSTKRKLPADITDDVRTRIRDLAVKTFQALGCNGVARIDFLLDFKTGEIWVNEINTIPGSLSFYLWEPVGIKYSELLDRLVQLGLKRQREHSNIIYSFESNILQGVKLGGTKGSKL